MKSVSFTALSECVQARTSETYRHCKASNTYALVLIWYSYGMYVTALKGALSSHSCHCYPSPKRVLACLIHYKSQSACARSHGSPVFRISYTAYVCTIEYLRAQQYQTVIWWASKTPMFTANLCKYNWFVTEKGLSLRMSLFCLLINQPDEYVLGFTISILPSDCLKPLRDPRSILYGFHP